jgi:hypothetical protein
MDGICRRSLIGFALLGVAVVCMGPGRCGTSAQGFFSGDPAPDVRGTWDVTYDNVIAVEIDVGGSTYTGTIAGSAGTVSFTHDGTPAQLALDCSVPWIRCPAEIFPASVTLEQRNFADRPHQVHMNVKEVACSGTMRLPVEADGECGGDTGLDCDVEMCDGTVTERTNTALGSISNPVPANPTAGSRPAYTLGLALGGGVAMPTVNCLLLAASSADGDVEYTGSYDPEENTMTGTRLVSGEINTIYAGGCFWGDAGGGTGIAALIGAQVRLTTSFTAVSRRVQLPGVVRLTPIGP